MPCFAPKRPRRQGSARPTEPCACDGDDSAHSCWSSPGDSQRRPAHDGPTPQPDAAKVISCRDSWELPARRCPTRSCAIGCLAFRTPNSPKQWARWDSNPHEGCPSADFKSAASADSATGPSRNSAAEERDPRPREAGFLHDILPDSTPPSAHPIRTLKKKSPQTRRKRWPFPAVHPEPRSGLTPTSSVADIHLIHLLLSRFTRCVRGRSA